MGYLEHIATAAKASQPMMACTEAEVIAGQGIVGDRYATKRGHYSGWPGAGRQITLIEAEVLEDLTRQGIPLAPHESRRNLTTRGIRLNPLVGHTLYIGTVVLEVIRLCEPCAYLQTLLGRPVLQVLVERGGIRCDVRTGGTIRVGDRIRSML